MELLIFVAALCVMSVLAMRYGHDSRETAESKEETWANLGLHLDKAGSTSSEEHPNAARSPLVHSEPAAHQRSGATPQQIGTSLW